jgi:hypothetical protein
LTSLILGFHSGAWGSSIPGNLTWLATVFGAGCLLSDPDGEAGVAVEGDLAAGEVVDEPVSQRHQLILREERHHAVGNNDGGPAGQEGVQPVLVPHVGADDMGVGVLGDQALASGGNSGEVDVVPAHGGRGCQTLESGVEPRRLD